MADGLSAKSARAAQVRGHVARAGGECLIRRQPGGDVRRELAVDGEAGHVPDLRRVRSQQQAGAGILQRLDQATTDSDEPRAVLARSTGRGCLAWLPPTAEARRGLTYWISGRFCIASGESGPYQFSSRICVGTFQTPAAFVSAASAAMRDSSIRDIRLTPKFSESRRARPGERFHVAVEMVDGPVLRLQRPLQADIQGHVAGESNRALSAAAASASKAVRGTPG